MESYLPQTLKDHGNHWSYIILGDSVVVLGFLTFHL